MDETQQEIQNLLGQLRDVHTPYTSWWPLAPGWWIVALVGLALCVFALRIVIKNTQQFQWVKVAEIELAALHSDFQDSKISSQIALSRLSVLLRRSSMAAKGRRAVARATDEQWIEIIAEVGNGRGFGRSAAEILMRAPYQPQSLPDEQVFELLQGCRDWLAGARLKRKVADV